MADGNGSTAGEPAALTINWELIPRLFPGDFYEGAVGGVEQASFNAYVYLRSAVPFLGALRDTCSVTPSDSLAVDQSPFEKWPEAALWKTTAADFSKWVPRFRLDECLSCAGTGEVDCPTCGEHGYECEDCGGEGEELNCLRRGPSGEWLAVQAGSTRWRFFGGLLAPFCNLFAAGEIECLVSDTFVGFRQGPLVLMVARRSEAPQSTDRVLHLAPAGGSE